MGAPKKPGADRRVRFAQEYAKDLNATQAAIRAGYAPKAAKVTGSRLLSTPNVRERVERILKRANDLAEITVERTRQEIARIAYGDRRKLFAEDGTLRPLSELDDDTASLLAGIETEEIVRGRGENKRVVGQLRKVKTFDKGRALEQCMSVLGMHKTASPGEAGGLNLTIRLSTDEPAVRRRG